MLMEVKKVLLESPDMIVSMLERFGFSSISLQRNEIRCARRDGGNPTAIRIKLTNNQYLFVRDYVTGASMDIFAYIVNEKHVEYREVVRFAKELTGVFSYQQQTHAVFGGLFSKVHKESSVAPINKVLPESELDQYIPIYSKRFMDDNIPCVSQEIFDIRYDVDSQRIIIPIRNADGDLIGAKGRANWPLEEDDLKYVYLLPCMCSETLFGYAQNFAHMSGNDVYICESEKAVMQAYGYGFRNFVGIAGNSLSDLQCKLLCQLFPRRVILMLDEGLKESIIETNIQKLKMYFRMFDTTVWRWVPYEGFPSKASPTDLGEETLKDIISNNLIQVG